MHAAMSKIHTLRTDLCRSFVERDKEVNALLVALLAEEHCLLLGSPGTAKSAIVQALATALAGRYFQRLLTPFSVPEELFGPFSVAALQGDRYERQTAGYLPTADVAFLDECFKANSAILNSLLTALNERGFDQGATRVTIPLKMAVGASNELPGEESLAALYDRFVLRCWVEPVKSRDNRRALILMAGAPATQVRITDEELTAARAHARSIPLADATVEALLDLREALAKEQGIEMSDRRMRKCVQVLRAYAALVGHDVVQPDDLEILADSLWNKPDERPAILGLILKIANPAKAEAQRVFDAAVEQFAKLDLANVSKANVSAVASTNSALKAMLGRVRELGPTVAQYGDKIEAMREQIQRAVSKALNA